MKKNNQVSKTVMHKCAFSNQVHELLETEQGKPRKERTPLWRKPQLTDAQKAEMFDKIVNLHRECSAKISKQQYERRSQKRKEAERVKTGYYEKKAARRNPELEKAKKAELAGNVA